MTYRRISPAESATITALYEDGYSLRSIGRFVGRKYQSVAAHLESLGLHQPIDRRVSSKYRARAVEWYDHGVNVEQIVRHFRISTTTLYADLRAQGKPLRSSWSTAHGKAAPQ